MKNIPELLPIEIPEKNIRMFMPLSFRVMTPEQYTDFFELFYQLNLDKITYADFATACVLKFLNLKVTSKKYSEEDKENAFSVIAQLAELIQEYFIVTDNKVTLKLDYSIPNPIEKMKIDGIIRQGPDDYYHNIEFGQYEDALNIFLQYAEMPSRELLQHLAATFFLPSDKKYDAAQARKNIEVFKNATDGELFGFYYNFASFHTYFSGSQVYYNGKIINLSILFETQPGDVKENYVSPYPGLGLRSTSIEIAKTGILGNLKEVRSTPLWDVALIMYDSRKKALDERAQEKLKTQKK